MRAGTRTVANASPGVDPDGREHHERRVAVSTQLLQAITDGRLDPVRCFAFMEGIIAPQLEGPSGEPIRALHVLRSAQPAFREAEMMAIARAHGDLTAPGRVFWRSQPQYLITRTLHALPAYECRALETGYANLQFLVDLAKPPENRLDIAAGHEAMRELMRSSVPLQLVEQTVAALSILMAIIKRNTLNDASRKRLVEDCRGLLQAYLLDRDGEPAPDLVVYPKTLALAAQGFYLFRKHGKPDDAALICALYERADLAAVERDQTVLDLGLLRRRMRVFVEQDYLPVTSEPRRSSEPRSGVP